MKRFTALLLVLGLVLALGIAAAQAENYKVGDHVLFGHYEQDNNANNGTEDIRWLVIGKDGDELFLLSQKGLEMRPFNKRSDGTMWKDSALREWLNSTFLYAAFTASEQNAILTTTVEDTLEHSNRNWNSGKRYGETAFDKVFLLSYKEMNEMVSKSDRYCEPSRHVIAQGCYTERHNGIKTCWYWLRTSAYNNNAVVVDAGGVLDTCYIHHTYGVVRPALWVNSSAVTLD